MDRFESMLLPAEVSARAPDGSDVRVLLQLAGGSFAHFTLGAGETSVAVAHRTIDEIWYFVRGRGELWRRAGREEETVAVSAGVCLTIPAGTHFQFRAHGNDPLSAVAVTMPPWPGSGEAYPVEGPWRPTVAAGEM